MSIQEYVRDSIMGPVRSPSARYFTSLTYAIGTGHSSDLPRSGETSSPFSGTNLSTWRRPAMSTRMINALVRRRPPPRKYRSASE